uniref:Uncharacterized protein n=1 Tax=Oryza punctata TaxID=4537 RepID=A0A0E0KZ25_ORYPU
MVAGRAREKIIYSWGVKNFLERRRLRNEDATEGAARPRGDGDGDGDGTALSSGRHLLSGEHAAFPFSPPLAKLGLGFSSLLPFPSSPPSLFSPCGFLLEKSQEINTTEVQIWKNGAELHVEMRRHPQTQPINFETNPNPKSKLRQPH